MKMDTYNQRMDMVFLQQEFKENYNFKHSKLYHKLI